MRRIFCTLLALVAVVILLSSCASYRHVNRAMSTLQLGMPRSEVVSRINEEPSYFKSELVDGVTHESLIFKSYAPGRNFLGDRRPILYVLTFENNRLVAIETKRDYEEAIAEGAQKVIDIMTKIE